jgi:hypothetical protein
MSFVTLSALKEDAAAQNIQAFSRGAELHLFVPSVSLCMQQLTAYASCCCGPSAVQVYGDNCWCYTDTSPGVFTGQKPRATASSGSSSSQPEQLQQEAASAAAGGHAAACHAAP